jgi:hypothetical protein
MLQQQLISGWATAAAEVAPHDVAHIDSWRERRLRHVAAGRSHGFVGHLDFVAWPR